jgi:hypothetical protein
MVLGRADGMRPWIDPVGAHESSGGLQAPGPPIGALDGVGTLCCAPELASTRESILFVTPIARVGSAGWTWGKNQKQPKQVKYEH